MREGTEAQGVVYGEAQGVATTKDAQGMATYTVQGIGRFTGPGKIRFHGSVFYRTNPTSGGKLSSLNNVVGVFEYQEDEQGNCSTSILLWSCLLAFHFLIKDNISSTLSVNNLSG
jgi:hypothetical protein